MDAGHTAAGRVDAGTADGGVVDGASFAAGHSDAGGSADGAVDLDTGDGGPVDAGRCATLLDAGDVGNPDAGPTRYNDIRQSANWAAYDSGEWTANNGAAFDGRYVYFAPSGWPGGPLDVVTRYDTEASFTAASAWTTFNPSVVNSEATGFWGATFDGRYVYFVPNSYGTVTRYDTQATFDNAASWSTFDAGTVSSRAKGFNGATFDGRYVYFVPHAGPALDGLVTRYDTQAAFGDAASWATFDTATVNASAVGFTGGVFDGRYLYLVPNALPSGPAGSTVARYDTEAAFGNSASWSTFDTRTVDANAVHFHGGAFDGRYVYLVPSEVSGGPAGLVVRYDTQAAFANAASWSTFSTTALSPDAKGFWDAAFDGRYVYFVPSQDNTGVVTRYDTQRAFGCSASWATFSTNTLAPASREVGAADLGAAVFDGRFVYLAPGSGGFFTRFDAKSPPSIPSLAAFFGSFL